MDQVKDQVKDRWDGSNRKNSIVSELVAIELL